MDDNASTGYRDLDLANGADFTALFCGNDYMAWGAIRRLQEEGVNVPTDVSVIGFDDIDIAPLIGAGLTTVRQDTNQMGRRSAELVIHAIEGQEGLIDSEVLPVELVVRGTVASVRDR